MKERSKKSNENTLPQDPLERCQLRWHALFWVVCKAVCEHDKNLRFGLLEALKKYGFDLNKGSVPENDPFKANPSDEVLQNALAFREGATIPRNLRGKKPPWKRLDPFLSLMAYYHILWMLKDLPKNKGARYKWFKEHLPEILDRILLTEKISDDDLEDSFNQPGKKGIALKLTAYLCNMEAEAFRSYLKEARRQYPEMAKACKHGMRLVPTQNSPVK